MNNDTRDQLCQGLARREQTALQADVPLAQQCRGHVRERRQISRGTDRTA